MTWAALETVLEGTGYPYARQGSYSEDDALPDTFVTFWNIETPEDSFYDNEPNRRIWRWQIYLYTTDPSIMYSAMDALLDDARANGFVLEGRAFDLSTDEPNYIGRTARLLYVETL